MNNDQIAIKEAIEKRFGSISERALDLVSSYNYQNKVLDAIKSGGDYECLPDSVIDCDWRPYYCDECNTWHECYIGYGLIVDAEGVYGIISSYDCGDWDNEYCSLTLPEEEKHYFQCVDEEYTFPEKDYLEWVIEYEEDPLNYAHNQPFSSDTLTIRVGCIIHLSFKRGDDDVEFVGISASPSKGKDHNDQIEIINKRIQESPEYLCHLLFTDFERNDKENPTSVYDAVKITEQSLEFLKGEIKPNSVGDFELEGQWDLPEDEVRRQILNNAKDMLNK